MEPAEWCSDLANRVSEPAVRAPEPAGSALEPGKRPLEPSKRALESAGRIGATWKDQLGAQEGSLSPTGPLPKRERKREKERK